MKMKKTRFHADHSRRRASPGVEAFVRSIRGEREPRDTAAFVAAICGESNLKSAAEFAAAILGEAGYDPNQPRDDWGRWTTGAGDQKSDDELRRETAKALAPSGPTGADDGGTRADANSVMFGQRKFTSKDGTQHFSGRFVGFRTDGRVLLRRSDNRVYPADPQVFSDEDNRLLTALAKLQQDKGFMAGLKAKPAKVHLDSSGVKGADPLTWEAQVMRDIGKLSELETGQGVLDRAKWLARSKEITIKRQSSGDNRASGGDVYYDPGRTIGARAQSGSKERPPFIGLGQELHNAMVNLLDPTRPWDQKEEGGLRVGQELRVEYNKTIRDAQRLKELTERYPGSPTGYPGWGTKEVDERVLGLNGRPLPRTSDRDQ
jgi:hypothetical protein